MPPSDGGGDSASVHGSCGEDQPVQIDRRGFGGEDIVIAKGSKPLVRLVALGYGAFTIGILEGRLNGPGPEFFDPLDESELGVRRRRQAYLVEPPLPYRAPSSGDRSASLSACTRSFSSTSSTA